MARIGRKMRVTLCYDTQCQEVHVPAVTSFDRALGYETCLLIRDVGNFKAGLYLTPGTSKLLAISLDDLGSTTKIVVDAVTVVATQDRVFKNGNRLPPGTPLGGSLGLWAVTRD